MEWVDRAQWPWEGRLVDVGEGKMHVVDVGTGPRDLARWRAELPNAEVLALPGAGHWPHEEEPDAVVRRLAEFLDATEGSTVIHPRSEV